MSYNGSGTFNINTAGQPVVTGTTITSTAFNLLTADLATGLSTALTKDGQTTPTANIPMGSFKLTGLGAGTAATDAAQYGQLQAGATTIATVTGTDTYVGTLTPAIAAYATGNLFSFVAPNTNTGAATINLNSLGAKNITKQGTTALIAGDIASGRVHLIEYDGTRFQLINPASSTGTGAEVFATSPTLVTPALGTPSSLVLTNATGLPNAGLVNSSITIGGTAIALGGSSNTLANDITIYGVTVGRGAGAIATNTAVGSSALAANTSGSVNTAIGYQAALSNTTGAYNTAVGYQSLKTNTTGTDNSAFGFGALTANTTGGSNVAVGESALGSNTTASFSTAVGFSAGSANTATALTAFGYQAGQGNTTGTYNTFIGGRDNDGYSPGYSTVTGGSLVAVGAGVLGLNTSGANSTGVGFQALRNNTTGDRNVAIGQSALYSNTTASANVAVGDHALQSNTTALYNVAVGTYSLGANTTGAYDVALGGEALRYNTTGGYVTAIGYKAGYSNTTGDYNTSISSGSNYSNTTGASNIAIGHNSGYSKTTGNANVLIGNGAGYSLTTGSYNTFIGPCYQGVSTASGDAMTTGSKNVIIGNYSGNQNALDIRTSSNRIILSDGDGIIAISCDLTSADPTTRITSSNSHTLGTARLVVQDKGNNLIDFYTGSKIGSITTNGTITIYNTTSDYRLKTVVGAVSNSGSRIDALKPIDYIWTEGGQQARGFLAHEFQEVYADSVAGTKDAVDAKGDPIYQQMQAGSSEVIADLVAEIQSLRKRLANAGIA